MNSKKIAKWGGISLAALFLLYAGSIVWFEARLGINQPQGATSLVIATFNNGERHERVVRLETIDGKNYVAANHWPRAWYHQALNNPNVEVKMPGTDSFEPFEAVNVEGEEDTYVREIYTFGFNFRFRTGFPPRYFLRLEPRQA
jgi:hypothetical protein